MPQFFKKHWPALTLVILSIVLCILNYTPGTFLSGWDTLHPEFDFLLNIKRLFFGVFREEQGLGAVAAHAHMADIPRVLLLVLFRLILPLSFLRYSYIFLTLILGPLGMYYFLRRTLQPEQEPHEKEAVIYSASSSHMVTLSAFLGGAWYLLNLGTMEQFVVPFEMFNALYAALPWLMLTTIAYLTGEQRVRRRSLIWFCLITFFASPMAYASTLWYVYFLLFLVFLGGYLFLTRKSIFFRTFLHRSVVLVGLTLLLNCFWLLPNLYFLLTHSSEVEKAFTNELFSPQAFLYNKEFGTPSNLLLLKSFLFDWRVYKDGGVDTLLQSWIQHLQLLPVLGIGYLTAGIALLGLIKAFFKKQLFMYALLPVLALTVFFLLTDNGPTGFLFALIRDHFPLFKEALRFPHSKFYIHYIFLFSFFFALGNMQLIELVKKISRPKLTGVFIYTAAVFLLLICFMLPAFKGELISPEMRITYPQEYFQLASWFQTKSPSARIATLPIHSFWGWEYYNWGGLHPSYQGSGFLWFFLSQPVLARDFDRWNPNNEEYYRELSQAVYTQNHEQAAAVLHKYAVSYVLLDTSVIAPTEDPTTLFYPQLKTLLSDSRYFTKRAQFSSHLFVYQVNDSTASPLVLLKNASDITPSQTTGYTDPAATQLSWYISNPTQQNAIQYPFRELLENDGRLQPDKIKVTTNGITLTLGSTRVAANYAQAETEVPTAIFLKRGQKDDLTVTFSPQIPGAPSLQPIHQMSFSLPKASSQAILNINHTTLLPLPNLKAGQTASLGQVLLHSNTANALAVFSTATGAPVSVDFSKAVYQVAPCKDAVLKTIYGVSLDSDTHGFTVFGSQTPVCVMIPLSSILDDTPLSGESTLLTTSYQTSPLPPQVSATLCLAVLESQGCVPGSTTALATDHTNTFGLTFAPAQKATLGIKLLLDTTRVERTVSSHFANLLFQLLQPLVQETISQAEMQASLSTHTDSTSPTLTLSYAGTQPIAVTSLPRSDGTCTGNPLVQTYPNQLKQIEDHQDFLRYHSDSGSICDHFSYQNLQGNSGYLLLVKARNVSGLPLTLCATNTATRRCDIYARLSQNHAFTTDVFFLPPTTSDTTGYDINLENLGVQGSPAVNDLATVQLIPIPATWLSQLATGPIPTPGTSQKLVGHELNDELSVILPKENFQGSTLTFTEAYEQGWYAYETDTGLAQTFPTLFGTPLTDHVTVNGWANGWKLDALPPLTSGKRTITILYLPQGLESFGWALTFLTLTAVMFSWWRKEKREE